MGADLASDFEWRSASVLRLPHYFERGFSR
jgi:hypothetical protein